jgi:signal transduction histidine kinase
MYIVLFLLRRLLSSVNYYKIYATDLLKNTDESAATLKNHQLQQREDNNKDMTRFQLNIHAPQQKFFITFLLFFFGCTAFANNNFVVERSFFEDKTGQLSFEQARHATYKKIDEILFNGYGNFPIWVKVKIDPNLYRNSNENSSSKSPLIIRISPAYLDQIQLFDPADSNTKPRLLGDHFPWRNNEHSSMNYAFEIPRGDQPREVWLQLKTTSTQMVKVDVFDPKSFDHAEKIQEIIFSIWLGLLAIIFVWSFGIWIVDHDKLVGNFVLNQLAVLLHASVIMGYFRIALDSVFEPKTIDLLGNVILLSFAFIVIRFQYCFHQEFALRSWVRWFFRSLLLFYPVALVLLFSNHISEALKLNVASLFITSFLIFLIPIFGIDWKKSLQAMISKRSLVAVDLLLLTVGLVNLLPALGILQTATIAPFVGLSYGIVTGFVFLLLLQHRYREIENQHIHAVSNAQATAVAEASKRIEQEKFLAMLTHELKTPLSVLLMAHTSKDGFSRYSDFVGDAIIDMQNVLERCMLADQFDSEALALKIDRCELSAAIADKIALYPQVRSMFEVSTPGSVFIQADIQLLNIILVNLFDNALKYGAEDEPIKVTLLSETIDDRRYALVQVANTPGNAGIPDPDKVFTKYYREPKAHAKTGSGLGLYLIDNIARAMGGTLSHIPQKDLVVFELRLPITD